jgi:hypothetical protein
MADEIDRMTQEKLKEILHYNPETGVFTWLKRIAQCAKIGYPAGSKCNQGYIRININKKGYKAHRLAWLYEYGETPVNFLDHINQVKDDNRICNLRLATNSQNQQNTKVGSRNKSGYKGIRKVDRASPWKVQITIDGKQTHVGQYSCIEDAIVARKFAEDVHHSHRVGG